MGQKEPTLFILKRNLLLNHHILNMIVLGSSLQWQDPLAVLIENLFFYIFVSHLFVCIQQCKEI